jgi:hypothetical protein
MSDTDINIKTETILNNGDLVYNVNKEGQIQSAGYNLNSVLMHSKISPMISISEKRNEDNDSQKGGKDKVSNLFKDLAIPAGLLLMQQKPIQHYDMNSVSDKHKNKDEKIIDDSLFNKLLNLAKQNDIDNENESSNKNKPIKIINNKY